MLFVPSEKLARSLRTLFLFFFILPAAIVGLGTPARAALGENIASLARESAALQASLNIVPRKTYEVHEMATPTGTVVRQFVGQHGKVFAVSWSGGFRPDLRELMGSHYDRFIESRRGKPRVRGPLLVELPGLVVFMVGRLRSHHGFVYLTDLLPAGLELKDIR